jgi:hypothetical protein
MEKLLIISNCSTYHTAPRGIQANRLINELAKYYHVYLVTSKTSIPDNVNYFSNDIKNVLIIRDFNYLFGKIFRRIWEFLAVRDDIWYFLSKNKVFRLIDQNKIKKVLTLSMHLSNAELGVEIKKKYNKCNVFSFFSDPISINDYLYKTNWQKRFIKAYEKKIFSNVNTVIFPSQVMMARYSEIYAGLKNKFYVIPHSYYQENSSIHKNRLNKFDKKIIRYIGGLNVQRNPKILFEFIKNNNSYFHDKNIVFEFYGSLSRTLKKQLSFKNMGCVEYKGKVSYIEVPFLIRSSFALLLIDANIPRSPFLPSKLIELLPYKIPIIGITPDDSESSRVLLETGNYCTSEEKIELLINIIDSIEDKNYNITNYSLSKYSIQNIGKSWKRLIG